MSGRSGTSLAMVSVRQRPVFRRALTAGLVLSPGRFSGWTETRVVRFLACYYPCVYAIGGPRVSTTDDPTVTTRPVPGKQWAVPGVAEHALREQLTNEIHARPAVVLRAPCKVSHLALLSGEAADQPERHHVTELCRRFGAAGPPADSNYWYVDLGPFRLNWERHTEFSTYTFIRPERFAEPFRDCVIERVPRDWLAGLTGEILVAIHLALEPAETPERSAEELAGLFASDNIAGSVLSGGVAQGWSDFRLHGDGFSRILLRDQGLSGRQAGRLVQRLLEIETYRMMALLAFPLARRIGVQVSEAEAKLGTLTAQLAASDGGADDHALLDQLTELAAGIERLAAAGNYRFSAARAYYALVQRRISELREARLAARAPIQEFMDRRLAPAIRTCESVSERLAVLSERVSRAANLLRTRVDVELERQNRDLLTSMNRRAQLQLRLQETVEGLSVAVISYYVVGLLGHAFKSLAAWGVPLEPERLTGLALPVVVLGVWFGIGRIRRRVAREATAS